MNQLTTFLCLLMLSMASCGPREPTELGQTLLLIVVDTWRGDHFLESRGDQQLTPRLAEFARSSLVFTDASSAGTTTLPGISGILTGLDPVRSTVNHNHNTSLPTPIKTVAELLRARGFRTAAFLGSPVLRPGLGYDQGFETYEMIHSSNYKKRSKTRSKQILDAALGWLSEVAASDNVLLWVHLMEPHGPYRPPQAVEALFPVDAFGERREATLLPKKDNTGDGGIPYYQHAPLGSANTDVRGYLSRYAAEVRSVDEAIGGFLAAVDHRRPLEDAIVIVTSDHGEALDLDHGWFFSHGHGQTVDQLHVPLLLRYPGCAEGTRIDRPVSTTDILPTILALLGDDEENRDFDGIDLLDPRQRRMLSEQLGERAVRIGDWRLVDLREGGHVLYDLRDGLEREMERVGEALSVWKEMEAAMEELSTRPALAPRRRRPAT